MAMKQSESKNELVRKLYLCGQIAEHKSEKAREHGGDEAEIFSALTTKEQAELEGMLVKLQAQWAKDHAEHHKKAD